MARIWDHRIKAGFNDVIIIIIIMCTYGQGSRNKWNNFITRTFLNFKTFETVQQEKSRITLLEN